MSTIKADAVTAKSTNTDVVITGAGTGVPDIETGFKVSGTAGLPITNLRVGTDGELITWDASGDPAAVAVGTATHVLTSNGAGAAPTFQAAGGKIGQVISSIKTDTASTATSTSGPVTFTDTGLTLAITPAATTSKIWLSATLTFGGTVNGDNCFCRFMRDSTAVGIGAAASDRTLASAVGRTEGGVMESVAISVLDSPSSTSEITYKVQYAGTSNAGTIYINRSNTDTDSYAKMRTASVLTAMEVLA